MVSSTCLVLLNVCTHLTEHGLQCLPHAAESMYLPHRTWSPAPAWLCWMRVLTSQNMVSSTCLVVLNVCTHLTEHGLQHLPGCAECMYSPHRTWSPVPPSCCWVRVLTSQNMVSSTCLVVLNMCTHLTEHGLQCIPHGAECVYLPHRTWSPAPAWLCWMHVLTSQNMVSSTCLVVLNVCTHLTEHGLQHLPGCAECVYSPHRTWSPVPPSYCWVHVLTSENMVSSTCLAVLNVCTHLTEHGLQCLPHGAECMYSPHRTWSPVPPSCCWVRVLTSENMVSSTCLVVLNMCTHLTEHGLQCLPHGAEYMVSSTSLMLLSVCTHLTEHGLQHLPGCDEYVYSPHRTWSPVHPSWCWVCVLTSQNMVSSASLMVRSVCTHLTEHGLQCLPHAAE